MTSDFNFTKEKYIDPATNETHLKYTIDIKIDDTIIPDDFFNENFNFIEYYGDKVVAIKAIYEYLTLSEKYKNNMKIHNTLNTLINILEEANNEI